MKQSFEIIRNVSMDWIKIKDDIYAYIINITDNCELSSSIEGLSTLKQLKSYSPLKNKIEDLSLKNSEFIKKDLYLCINRIEESVRTILFEDLIGIMLDFIIMKPFSFIKENGLENVSLYDLSYSDYTLRDINGNIYPKSLHFEYINANIHNMNYDLNEALEILKKREDIVFTDLPKGVNSLIQPIPYFNATGGRDSYIDFNWIPNKEDFDNVLKNTNDLRDFDHLNYIIENIFKIKRLAYVEDFDDDEEYN